jgi:hypothetical protein
MSTENDDAQRGLEQRALRNVRALVDKYEGDDVRERKSVGRLVVVIVASILVLFAIAYAVFRLTVKQEPASTVVLPPPAKAAR